MLRRALGTALVALLILTLVGPVEAAPVAAKRAKHHGFACDGLAHSKVRGDRPTYSHKTLSRFRNAKRMCAGWWLPKPRKRFVPQGVAVDGRTAWVSGFRYQEGYGQRACRLVQVNLRTGHALDRRALVGRVGKRPLTYCRHGGGITQTGQWLWVVQKSKLWLFDPAASPGTTIRAARVWRLEEPVRGSSVVFDGKRIGLVPFQLSGVPHIYWFKLSKMIRRGVLDLGARRTKGVDLAAADSTRVPTHVQGAAIGPNGKLYLTRSNLRCGELVTPARRIAFVPGAEGIQFSANGKRLWAVSESGAQPYAGPRKPLTPAISSWEWPGLTRGKPSNCDFR